MTTANTIECSYGCGQIVYWGPNPDRPGKKRTFNADGPEAGSPHFCPNYDPNKFKNQPKQTSQYRYGNNPNYQRPQVVQQPAPQPDIPANNGVTDEVKTQTLQACLKGITDLAMELGKARTDLKNLDTKIDQKTGELSMQIRTLMQSFVDANLIADIVIHQPAPPPSVGA